MYEQLNMTMYCMFSFVTAYKLHKWISIEINKLLNGIKKLVSFIHVLTYFFVQDFCKAFSISTNEVFHWKKKWRMKLFEYLRTQTIIIFKLITKNNFDKTFALNCLTSMKIKRILFESRLYLIDFRLPIISWTNGASNSLSIIIYVRINEFQTKYWKHLLWLSISWEKSSENWVSEEFLSEIYLNRLYSRI